MSVLKYYNTQTGTWLPAALGDIGPTGPTGAPGNDSMVPGPTGDQGPQGPTGNDGVTGPQGEVGATGPQGELGPTGNDGAVGPTGPQGEFGATGPQGELGPTGNDGAPGMTGPQGEVGPTGVPGTDALWNFLGEYSDTPMYAEGDIVTYNGETYRRNGSDNNVTGYHPTVTQYWDKIAERGADGAEGPTGPAGEVGPTGADSTVPGPTGDTGPQGSQGEVGPTGPAGSGEGGPTDRITTGSYSVILGEDGIITLPNTMTIDASGTGGEDVRIGGTSTWISVNNNGAPPGFYVRTSADSTPHQWMFDVDGNFTAPGHLLPEIDLAYDLGSTSSQWRSIYVGTGTIYIGGVALGVNQDNYVTVDGNPIITVNTASGSLTVQGNTNIVLGSVIVSDTAPAATTIGSQWFNTLDARTYIAYNNQWVDSSPLIQPTPDTDIDVNSITFPDASVQTSAYSNKLVNGVKEIVFDSNGNLILPAGGDILDSTGTSVLSGGSSVAALSDLYDVLIEGPVEGSVLTWNDSQSLWENRSVTAITNTYPDGPTYSVSVGSDGVVSMITSRGTVEFGALPEPGGPTHFHIMKGSGQDGSGGLDLFFGDDYNYVRQRPAQYGQAPAYGVEIGANDISTNTNIQHVWRFGTDGILTLPEGGDIVDSTGTSLLSGGSGAVGPTGPQGEVGPTGPAGSDGTPGSNGMDGLPGAPGSNGIDGLDGAPGPQGDTGPTGAQGVVGPTGPVGLVGDYVSALTAGTGTSVSASTGSVTVWFNTSTLVTAAVSATTAVSLYNGGYTLRSVAVPGNLAGSAGDTVGDIASNGTNLYYCTVSSTQTNYIGVTAGGASGPKYVNLLKSGYNGPSAPVAGMIVTLRGVSHTITSVTDQSTYWQLNYSASEAGSNWGPGETVTITTEPAVGNIWKTVPWDAISTSTTSTVTINNNTVSTSTTTGALVVSGGVGIGGDVNVGGTSSNIIRRASGLVAADTYVTLDDLQARVTSGTSQLSLILTSGSWQGTGWTETFTSGSPSISNWVNLPLSTGYDFASGAMNSQGHGCRCVISDQTPSAKMYQITVIRSGTSGAMWNISIERLV